MPGTALPPPTPISPADPGGVRSLVDEFIAEHRALAPIERFNRWLGHHGPAQDPDGFTPTSLHRALLPVTSPAPGEQYAFEVDLDACSGCKACVTACHALNGLEDDEAWRSVGLLVERQPHGSPRGASVATGPRHVTTACHHCLDPACLHGCPVLAYDKDPVSGIVRHLDDQCIGCSYCTMTCPYEVPRYSARLGIVRKCDLCTGRLAAGEAPACAAACPSAAIRIRLVDTRAVRERYNVTDPAERVRAFLPGTPDPALTCPTTRFVARTGLAGSDLEPADHAALRPAAPHTPLAVMLVLTQTAAGLFVAEALTGWAGGGLPATGRIAALVILALGLLASVAHLGQPSKAWRAFLGWRRSWLSREILALGAFFGIALGHTAASVIGPVPGLPVFPTRLGVLVTAGAGAIGVFTSVRVYAATRRRSWSFAASAVRFFGTMALTALAAVACFAPSPAAWTGLALASVAKLALETLGLRSAAPELRRTRHLLQGPLRACALARLGLGALSVAGAGLAGLGLVPLAGPLGLTALLAGELLERHLFFRAAAPDRMPGLP